MFSQILTIVELLLCLLYVAKVFSTAHAHLVIASTKQTHLILTPLDSQISININTKDASEACFYPPFWLSCIYETVCSC